jgi:hypothetical protein
MISPTLVNADHFEMDGNAVEAEPEQAADDSSTEKAHDENA